MPRRLRTQDPPAASPFRCSPTARCTTRLGASDAVGWQLQCRPCCVSYWRFSCEARSPQGTFPVTRWVHTYQGVTRERPAGPGQRPRNNSQPWPSPVALCLRRLAVGRDARFSASRRCPSWRSNVPCGVAVGPRSYRRRWAISACWRPSGSISARRLAGLEVRFRCARTGRLGPPA